MDPISEYNWVPGYIPVCTLRTMDKQRSVETVGVLKRIVAVIPRCSILIRLKTVGKGIACSDRALSHTCTFVRHDIALATV